MSLVLKSETKEIPEWQRKVGYATNAAGAIAGPAAIMMAVRGARKNEGGIPRAATQAAASSRSPRPVRRAAVRGLKFMQRNKPAAIAAGATGVGLQVANWTGDTIAANALRGQKEPASKSWVKDEVDNWRIGRRSAKEYRSGRKDDRRAGKLERKAGYLRERGSDRRDRASGLGRVMIDHGRATGSGWYAGEKGHEKGHRTLRRALNAPDKAVQRLKSVGGQSRSQYLDEMRTNYPEIQAERGRRQYLAEQSKKNEKARVKREKKVSKSIESGHVSAGVGSGQVTVGKRYYDAESDRQRRTGVIAGLAGGTSLVTGAEAARRISADPIKSVELMDGTRLGPKTGKDGKLVPVGRKVGLRGNGKGKTLAALAGASVASGALGVGMYRHGMSRRNRSWQ